MGWKNKKQKQPLKTGIEKTEKVELVTFDGRQFKCDPASPYYEYVSVTYIGLRKKQKTQKKQNKKNKQGNRRKMGRGFEQNLGRRSGVSQWHPGKQLDPKDWWRRR